jgi:hypothetical protein
MEEAKERERAATDSRSNAVVALYTHVNRRLRDEFSINLTSEWEACVVGGEHDVPLPYTAYLEYNNMRRAMRNVSMVARRIIARNQGGFVGDRDDVIHILRFCEEAGITSSILREAEAVNSIVQQANVPHEPNYDI